jgi:amino acid efflux transporter
MLSGDSATGVLVVLAAGLLVTQAGPASLIILGALLAVSAPIAFTFVALSRALPSAKGVAGYAAAAFGTIAGQLVSAWFRYGVPIGVPALGLIGGEYVAEATGGGRETVVAVAVGICATAVVVSIAQRAGTSALTLVLSLALTILIIATAALALPHAEASNLTPVAPNGYLAVAASALVLTWVLTGWEAVTNFTDVLRTPRRTLPRVTVATLVIVGVLYAAVAVLEILVLGPTAGGTGAPVAAMLRVAVGSVGAIVAGAVAVIIATGNSIAYVGSLAELGTATQSAAAGRAAPDTRARALVVPVLIMVAGLLAVALTPISTKELVSICAGSQVPVYVLGLAAGIKMFPTGSRRWWSAVIATAAVTLLLIPAGIYLVIPTLIAVLLLGGRAHRRRSATPQPG